MLRILESESSSSTVTLRLEGRVVGPWVAEVRRYCERFLGEGRSLALDVAEVAFVDREGIALLLELQRRQVSLVRCSSFLLEQLRVAGGNGCDPPAAEPS
jgi:ABC-type transporter Mla MlaB component